MSQNIKTEFILSAYLCNSCRLVLSKTLIHEDPFFSEKMITTPAKINVFCQRCGYEDREHPEYTKTINEVSYGMGDEFELRCSHCNSKDLYVPTPSGYTNCTNCEREIKIERIENEKN